jgi:hypothetical protein
MKNCTPNTLSTKYLRSGAGSDQQPGGSSVLKGPSLAHRWAPLRADMMEATAAEHSRGVARGAGDRPQPADEPEHGANPLPYPVDEQEYLRLRHAATTAVVTCHDAHTDVQHAHARAQRTDISIHARTRACAKRHSGCAWAGKRKHAHTHARTHTYREREREIHRHRAATDWAGCLAPVYS